jgi:hypothetical protein
MQEDHGRRAFRASKKPTTSGCAVAILPAFLSNFQGLAGSAYCGKYFGSDHMWAPWRARNSVDNRRERYHHRHKKHKQDRQQQPKKLLAESSSGGHEKRDEG